MLPLSSCFVADGRGMCDCFGNNVSEPPLLLVCQYWTAILSSRAQPAARGNNRESTSDETC